MTRVPRKLKKMFKADGLVARATCSGEIYGHRAGDRNGVQHGRWYFPRRYWR